MSRRYLNLTGFVLAGGASRRMGRPKPALVVGGETMLARQVRLLGSVSRVVEVIGRAQGGGDIERVIRSLAPPEVSVIGDEVPGRGPLGGIYTGLARTRTEFNLFIGCDLPFLEARFLDYLCRRALDSRADVTVPMSPDHGFQPLAAVYRRRALRAIRASLDRGENKVTRFYSRVRCQVLGWPELSGAGFSVRLFANMNTWDDYQRVRRWPDGGNIGQDERSGKS